MEQRTEGVLECEGFSSSLVEFLAVPNLRAHMHACVRERGREREREREGGG